MRAPWLAIPWLLAAVLTWSCRERGGDPPPAITDASAAAAERSAASSATADGTRMAHGEPLGVPAEWRACAARIARLQAEPALPGAPAFEAERVQMVGRVRGAAVIWKREPRSAESDADARAVIEDLESSAEPLQSVRKAIRKYRRRPQRLRAIFLREGYLYARGVDLALAAVQQLGLTHLFREPQVYLLREGSVRLLRRDQHRGKAHYRYADGPLAGERAEVLLADRVGTEVAELTREPLAISFSGARERFAFQRLRHLHLTKRGLVAEARYGAKVWVPVVFDVDESSARLACHGLTTESARPAMEAQQVALRAAKVQSRIRAAVRAQVRERLPFDAPRGTEGDPTDKYPLRARWQDAYAKSMRSFRFQDKRYDVYDEQGRPLLPQVCIDFVYDTWERAGGTWYAPMVRDAPGAPLRLEPKRIVGAVDVDRFGLEQRRRVSKFLEFARHRTDLFDLWQTPVEDRVVFADHDRFFAMLAEHADQFRRGDVLVVRRVKSEGRALHHNLIVLDSDLLTGIPTLLAGNSARPRIQTFDGVMQITPRRYLQYRIRPKPEWLDDGILRSIGDREGASEVLLEAPATGR